MTGEAFQERTEGTAPNTFQLCKHQILHHKHVYQYAFVASIQYREINFMVQTRFRITWHMIQSMMYASIV